MDISKLESLINARLSLNDYLLLLSKKNPDEKFNSFLPYFLGIPERIEKKLVRRGFLDDTFQLTEKGRNILEGIYEPENIVEVLSPAEKELKQFEEFWEAYPVSDKWGAFPKTRILRSDKPRALKYYKVALKEVSHENLLKALQLDVDMKKKNSTLRNEMAYMPAICAWLNRRNYEGFLDSLEDEKIETVKKFGEDVG